MSGVCFVDTETTGLDPDRHQIWNVGLIEPDGTETEWFLRVDLSTADAIALKIGGYFDRHPLATWQSDRPDLWDLASFASDFMERTWGHHLAGAVVSFDEERLRRLLRTNGACPGWHYHLIDVEALALGWLAHKATALRAQAPAMDDGGLLDLPWKSERLSVALGVNPEDFDRHTALGDARWAKAIYGAVLGS